MYGTLAAPVVFKMRYINKVDDDEQGKLLNYIITKVSAFVGLDLNCSLQFLV